MLILQSSDHCVVRLVVAGENLGLLRGECGGMGNNKSQGSWLILPSSYKERTNELIHIRGLHVSSELSPASC